MTSKKVCLNVWRNAHAVVTAVQGEIAARWIEVSLYDHDKRLDISEKTAAIYMTNTSKCIRMTKIIPVKFLTQKTV
mgnify:CR=1 FL=1